MPSLFTLHSSLQYLPFTALSFLFFLLLLFLLPPFRLLYVNNSSPIIIKAFTPKKVTCLDEHSSSLSPLKGALHNHSIRS